MWYKQLTALSAGGVWQTQISALTDTGYLTELHFYPKFHYNFSLTNVPELRLARLTRVPEGLAD